MEEHPVMTWYVARRVGVGPPDAGWAFDTLVDAGRGPDSRFGPLVLDPPVVWAIETPRTPERRIGGRLHLARSRAVRVEVELSPWSADRTELGLRPRSAPRGGRAAAYFSAAHRALDDLRVALERSAREVVVPQELERAS